MRDPDSLTLQCPLWYSDAGKGWGRPSHCFGASQLEGCFDNDDLLVPGAEYSLETGFVNFFDGLPDSA